MTDSKRKNRVRPFAWLLIVALLLSSFSLLVPTISAHAASKRDKAAKQAIVQGILQQKRSFTVPNSDTITSTLLRDVMEEHPKLNLYANPVFQNVKESPDGSKTVYPHYLPELIQASQQFLRTAPWTGSDYQKELWVHDRLIQHITYTKGKKSIAEALLQGKCDCMGYSRTTAALLDALGVSCAVMDGDTTNKGNPAHEWNRVVIDGKPYLLDVTWDDMGDGKAPIHRYFNVSKDQMKEDHSPWAKFQKDWDTCCYTDQNYYQKNQLLCSSFWEARTKLQTHPEVQMNSKITAELSYDALRASLPGFTFYANIGLGVIARR